LKQKKGPQNPKISAFKKNERGKGEESKNGERKNKMEEKEQGDR
jgi:hypothetical protein